MIKIGMFLLLLVCGGGLLAYEAKKAGRNRVVSYPD